jgi:hypothetical protein
MRRGFHWFALFVFAALIAVSPALAANPPASSTSDHSAAAAMPAPSTVVAPATSSTSEKSVLVARAPFESVWNSTVTSMNSQAMGLHARGSADHMKWTLTGAAIGGIIGLVAGDPLRDALIGGVVGLAGSYVIQR